MSEEYKSETVSGQEAPASRENNPSAEKEAPVDSTLITAVDNEGGGSKDAAGAERKPTGTAGVTSDSGYGEDEFS